MKKSNMIIAGILVAAILTLGAVAFIPNQSQAATIPNTITEHGTKLALTNNNNEAWAHMEMVIVEATLPDGSTQTFYVEFWMTPGGTTTIDLSNILGYGDSPLPTGTTLRMLTWSGVNSPTPEGNSNLALSLQGWSNTATPPGTAPSTSLDFSSLPVAQLPTSITGNTALIGTSPADVNVPGEDEGATVTFSELLMTVDANGNLVITVTTPPELCTTIAQPI